MTFYNQAPALFKNGEKFRNGLFTQRPQELEYAICCCLGNRDIVAIKVMLFLTGNSNDGDFRIAQKTIFNRMNISEKPYYSARKKLIEMGWINYDPKANAIYINYDKIYEDYQAYLKSQKSAQGCNDSPISFGTQNSPALNELQEQSSNANKNRSNDSPEGCYQNRYNNINNKIKNNINKKISGAGAAVAAPPQICLDTVNDFKNGTIDKLKAMEIIEDWYYSELDKLRTENGLSPDSEEYKSKADEMYEIGSICFAVFNKEREDYYTAYA